MCFLIQNPKLVSLNWIPYLEKLEDSSGKACITGRIVMGVVWLVLKRIVGNNLFNKLN